MTRDEIRTAVLAALRRIAPEIDPAIIRPADSLREQADIDSVDFLNFIVALHATIGVDVPEGDYPHMQSIDGCVDYLARRLDSAGAPPAPGVTPREA